MAVTPQAARASTAGSAEAYRAEVESWRATREVRLRAPEGWLSVVALWP